MPKDHEKSAVQCRGNTSNDNPKKTSDIFQRDRRQINTLDDSKEMGTGSYYSGSWAEQSSSGDEPDQQEVHDSSDDDLYTGGPQTREGGSAKGEGKEKKGKK